MNLFALVTLSMVTPLVVAASQAATTPPLTSPSVQTTTILPPTASETLGARSLVASVEERDLSLASPAAQPADPRSPLTVPETSFLGTVLGIGIGLGLLLLRRDRKSR